MKKFSILQIKNNVTNSRYIKFSSLNMVDRLNITLTLDMYEQVYEGEIEEEATDEATMDSIWSALNTGKKPEGYKGHSLSVSDLIKMDGKFYYVDDIGFEEIEFNTESK